MEKTVDAMGLACPLPVVEAKKASEGMSLGDKLTVLVDNEIAVQNLTKFAKSKNYDVNDEKKGDKEYVVTMVVGEENGSENESVDYHPGNNAVVVLSSNTMGIGDDTLGKNLMKAFVFALTQQDELPKSILCYNGGVKLTCNGSESLEDFKKLEEAGVNILSCGTCLDFYELKDELAVGGVTNMYEIVEVQSKASVVIRP